MSKITVGSDPAAGHVCLHVQAAPVAGGALTIAMAVDTAADLVAHLLAAIDAVDCARTVMRQEVGNG